MATGYRFSSVGGIAGLCSAGDPFATQTSRYRAPFPTNQERGRLLDARSTLAVCRPEPPVLTYCGNELLQVPFDCGVLLVWLLLLPGW